ncbi:E3 ubiquitin-protein ligase RNFT1 isoform X1 [Hemibagrus wyckioides]|uniref:E3 ubiquitin-protein ligase RNFT1 isoform X1 n=1 Tax=Hemibagrus wyckioides TaxID=337641 RepID=UPI00266BDFF2|nr:E3 ubiquitin-protein ligase RNFT1 isoform X1 [Hemibagrus wyckioides]
MKFRLQYGRRASHVFRRELTSRESTVMPTESCSQDGTGLSFTLQPELVTSSETSNAVENADGRLSICSSLTGEENGTRSASRRLRPAGLSHSHSHSRSRSRMHAEAACSHTDLEAGESSTSISELRFLFCWVQKSLPFIIILCSKLISQHALGLAVGVGLFTTFLHVNKNIQAQVVLQNRRSKLQCFWHLSFLMASSLLLYYTFQMDSLYYCLILINPQVEPMDIWEVLWTVGVTSFIVKFLFMGLKCLILLLPTCVMVYRRRGQCYMFIEELGQFYQLITPVPPWFHYLLTSKMVDGSVGVTMDILLALLYIILKLLELYSQWGSLQNTVQNFLTYEVNGAPATQSQCCSAGDLCLICQSKFKQPRVLLCQILILSARAMDDNRITRVISLCKKVVSSFSYSWRKRRELAEVQIQLGLPAHQFITESATCLESWQQMMERFLEQEVAITKVLYADKKSRHLVPTWQTIEVLVSIQKSLKPLQDNTDLYH